MSRLPTRTAQRPPPAPAREPERPDWAHPALTGLAATDWNQMISALAVPHKAQRDAQFDAWDTGCRRGLG